MIVRQEGWLPEIRPAVLGPDARSAPWTWLEESYALVAGVLADDLKAKQANPALKPGPDYWRVFLHLQGSHVKEQMTLAAQRTAQMILLAWTDAGSPPPPLRALISRF